MSAYCEPCCGGSLVLVFFLVSPPLFFGLFSVVFLVMDSVAALVSGSAQVAAAAASSVLLVSNASSSSSSSRSFDVNITAASSFPICSRRTDSLFLSSASSGVVAVKRRGGLVWRKPLRCVAVDSTSTLEAAATAAAAVEPTSDDAIPIEKRKWLEMPSFFIFSPLVMNGMMRRAGFVFSACFLNFSFGCQMLCSSSLSMAFCVGKIEWGLIGETLFLLLFFFFLDLKMSFVLSSSCHSLFLWILFQQVRESSKDCLLWLVLDANIWMELLTKCNVNVCVLGVDRQMPWMDPAF